MRKNRLFNHMIITTLVLSFIIGSASSYVSAESVSENDTTVISVSENASETLSPAEDDMSVLGNLRDIYIESRNNLINQGYQFTNVDLPNNGTWGYDQTFARNELFPKLNEARMNEKNWWLCDNNTNPIALDTPPTKVYVYDTKLEEAAMQRAAELLFAYIHTRPDRVGFGEVYQDQDNPYQWASN